MPAGKTVFNRVREMVMKISHGAIIRSEKYLQNICSLSK